MSLETPIEPLNRFLQDLEAELAWEWKWMRWNRAWTFGFHWAGWIAKILLLAAATFQLSTFSKGKPELWLIGLIALLSTLNIALPFISHSRLGNRVGVGGHQCAAGSR